MNINRKLIAGIFLILLAPCLFVLSVHSRIILSLGAEFTSSLGGAVGPVLEEGVAHLMLSHDEHSLRTALEDLGRRPFAGAVFFANDKGIITAATNRAELGRKAEIGKPLSPDAGVRTSYGMMTGEDGFRWVQPVRNRPECRRCHRTEAPYVGAVIVDFPVRDLQQQVRRHVARDAAVLLGLLVLVGLGIFGLSNAAVIRRLKDLSGVMALFEKGNRDARVSERGGDEISMLGRGFNAMACSIAASENELRLQADEVMALAVSTNAVASIHRDENIYEASCVLAVREMRLRAAWVGIVTPGETNVEPVGWCASGGEYRPAADSGERPIGREHAEQAAGTGSARVINDGAEASVPAGWREEALKHGVRSSAALPLLRTDGSAVAVLNLFSGEPGYFTPWRVRLFTIFANQVAAAIENRSLIERTEKKAAALARQFEMISLSQKEWQMTFDSITDLITIHDRNYRIIRANRAVADYFGVRIQDVISRPCFELFHGTCSPVRNCPHATTLSENRVSTEEVLDPKTNKIFAVSTFPYDSSDGALVGSIHIAKDITDVREKETRLIMSERLAALGQLASGIAHEINNPLASIGGCAEGLIIKIRNGAYDPALFEEYLRIIQEEVMRCSSITTGMLSFVRSSSYQRKELNINEALEKAVEIIGFQGRLRNVEIVREYADNLPVIEGSEGELRQVFLALITNALDAMEDRGTLTVKTSARQGSLGITISDTGPGIAPENLGRIFDPFFTTKAGSGGTGLGLSIVHKIITGHGGSIDVRSGKDGAAFIVTLPLA